MDTKQYETFTRSYLQELKANYAGFLNYFGVIKLIFIIECIVSGIFALIMLFASGILGALSIIILTMNVALVVWLSVLLMSFIELQMQKIQADIDNKVEYQSQSLDISENILEKVKRRAESIVNDIKVFGSNYGNISAISGNNNKVEQNTSGSDGQKIAEAIAMLLAYCEEAKNDDALSAAKKLATEAENPDPDRGVIFELWNQITTLVPQIGAVVKIANGIKGLLS